MQTQRDSDSRVPSIPSPYKKNTRTKSNSNLFSSVLIAFHHEMFRKMDILYRLSIALDFVVKVITDDDDVTAVDLR